MGWTPQIIVEAEAKETGPRFLDCVERWLDNPTWRCASGHVSKRYLKSELKGAICLACHQRLWLTFPEDEEATP